MKKLIMILAIIILMITNKIFAGENWIKDYGYYDFESEIKAKNYLKDINIPEVFEYHAPSVNPSGNKIEAGKPYIEFWTYRPEKYGSITGIKNSKILDPDYIYLEDFYNSITATQLSTNKRQDKQLQDHENRINKLEETQYIISLESRIYDSKKWQINVFGDYSTNRSKIDRAGIKFTYKFGLSYEEKLIIEQNKRLEQIEKLLNIKTKSEIIGKTKDGYDLIAESDGTIRINKKF